MVAGMATQKITVTLDKDQVAEIRALVAAGQAANVSGFVQRAVGVALHDAAGWKEMLEDGLAANWRRLNQKRTRRGRRVSLSAGAEEGSQEGEGCVSGVTFDAGGLMALDRNDRRVLALVARAAERGMRITIPATALAQAMRNPARQARLSRLIRQSGTDLVALNGPDATAAGLLLARTATADVVDAHVVVCARRAEQAVVTSEAADLRRIAPDLQMVAV
jgi:Arc/MetJ-type ribon-helix-helix transcriptional regulator